MVPKENGLTREIAVSRRFYGLAFDDVQLAAIARKLSALGPEPSDWRSTLYIHIVSADGQETIDLKSPDDLSDTEMPRKIRSVRINRRLRNAQAVDELAVSVSLGSDYASLSVESPEGVRARAVFSEIERELLLRREGYWWIARLFGNSPLISIPIGIIGILLLLLAVIPLMKSSGSLILYLSGGDPSIAIIIASVLFVPSFLAIAFGLIRSAQKAFPDVRFHGRFHDSGARTRRILLVVLLPLLVGIAGKFIYDHSPLTVQSIPKESPK